MLNVILTDSEPGSLRQIFKEFFECLVQTSNGYEADINRLHTTTQFLLRNDFEIAEQMRLDPKLRADIEAIEMGLRNGSWEFPRFTQYDSAFLNYVIDTDTLYDFEPPIACMNLANIVRQNLAQYDQLDREILTQETRYTASQLYAIQSQTFFRSGITKQIAERMVWELHKVGAIAFPDRDFDIRIPGHLTEFRLLALMNFEGADVAKKYENDSDALVNGIAPKLTTTVQEIAAMKLAGLLVPFGYSPIGLSEAYKTFSNGFSVNQLDMLAQACDLTNWANTVNSLKTKKTPFTALDITRHETLLKTFERIHSEPDGQIAHIVRSRRPFKITLVQNGISVFVAERLQAADTNKSNTPQIDMVARMENLNSINDLLDENVLNEAAKFSVEDCARIAILIMPALLAWHSAIDQLPSLYAKLCQLTDFDIAGDAALRAIVPESLGLLKLDDKSFNRAVNALSTAVDFIYDGDHQSASANSLEDILRVLDKQSKPRQVFMAVQQSLLNFNLIETRYRRYEDAVAANDDRLMKRVFQLAVLTQAGLLDMSKPQAHIKNGLEM